MKLRVNLSHDELRQAAYAGLERRLSAMGGRRREMSAYRTYRYESHIQAAIGEYAVAKAFQLDWIGPNLELTSRKADVGELEVRTILHDDGHLIEKARDVPHQKLVLTRVQDHEVLILGWATAQVIRDQGRYIKAIGRHGLQGDQLFGLDDIGYPVHLGRQVMRYDPRHEDRFRAD